MFMSKDDLAQQILLLKTKLKPVSSKTKPKEMWVQKPKAY